MRSLTAQAVSLAAQLAAATGQDPRTEIAPERARIEVDLPAALGAVSQAAVLAALADADRYGHDLHADGAVVWAELTRRS